MDVQENADALRNKAGKKKTSEEEKETKERMKKTLSRRDQAIKAIEGHQDKTGIPTDNEVDGIFITDEAKVDLNLDEFQEKENDDEV